jgi:hypothetical protein
MVSPNDTPNDTPNDRLRLPPPWISPAAGMPDREVRPVIIVQRRRLLYPAYVQDYLDRVTAADVAAGNTSGLEFGVTDGANTFIQDLVNDGLLGVSGGVISQAASVIKASPIMAGARTRLGAMTPLVGSAPTSFNFVDGDYNRKTGLVGDGSTKYLNSNRNNNADPQNNRHLAAYANLTSSGNQLLAGGRSFDGVGATLLGWSGTQPLFRCIPNTDTLQLSGSASVGTATLFGFSRNNGSNYTARVSGSSASISSTSATPNNINLFIFAQNNQNIAPSTLSNARFAFYSIGESLDLALLDARVTALINAYAAAIP